MKVTAWVCLLSLSLPVGAHAESATRRSDLIAPQLARDLQPGTLAQAIPTPPVLTPQIETRQTPPPAAPTYGIPQAQIQKQGAESLAETLRGLPGFAINDVGPAADIHTGSYYRGASINQSAVLLNGRPLGTNVNTYHGTTDFNSIAVESIEKVELSSGSSSTLHGTEAVGGVVNLVTKKGRGAPRLSTSVEYGSLGQANYRSSYSGAGEQVSYNLSYQSFLADNRYAVPVGAANRDPATGLLFNGDTYRNSYFASVSYEPDSRNTISFDLTKFISRRGLLYFGFPLQRDRLDHDGLNAGLSWRHLLGGGEDSILKTTVGFNQDFFNTYGPSGNFNRTGTVDTKQLSVRVEHEWFTSPNHNLRYGFDGLNTRLNGEALSTVPTQVAFNDREDRSVFNGALFALSAWNITPSLQLETGSRLTFNGLFGNYFNPSGGLRWTLDRAVTLRASVASVQRNPGLDQLFLYDVVHTWLPNSDLRPETGASYSAGLDVQFSPAWRGQFTYFGNGLDNRLGIVAGQWQNIGSVTTNGLEVALRYQIAPEWTGFLNYTYTDARILNGPEAGLQLGLIPYSVAQAGVGYENGGWQLNLIALYSSGSRRALFQNPNIGNTDFSPAWASVDIRARVPLTENVALTAFLENLADVQYERANRIFAPGLTYRVGLQSSF